MARFGYIFLISEGEAIDSSIFRALNKYEVKLNGGKFSGPLGSRKKNDTSK